MDPFSDQAAIAEERDAMADSTLTVGRNATLTLGTDSLIILGRLSVDNVSDLLTRIQMMDSAMGNHIAAGFYRVIYLCST